MKKLKEVVDKQRDEIRAKDRELTLKNEDIEAVSEHFSISVHTSAQQHWTREWIVYHIMPSPWFISSEWEGQENFPTYQSALLLLNQWEWSW